MQALDYNVPGGKLNRGMAVADVLRAIKEGQVSCRFAKLFLLLRCRLSSFTCKAKCD